MRFILVTGGAAIERARSVLEARRFEPRDGIAELAGWVETQTAVDRVDHATAELMTRGLAR